MPRTKGAVNKPKENPPAKYRVTLRNPFDDSVSSMDFPHYSCNNCISSRKRS